MKLETYERIGATIGYLLVVVVGLILLAGMCWLVWWSGWCGWALAGLLAVRMCWNKAGSKGNNNAQ